MSSYLLVSGSVILGTKLRVYTRHHVAADTDAWLRKAIRPYLER
jgi:hypothetical protein